MSSIFSSAPSVPSLSKPGGLARNSSIVGLSRRDDGLALARDLARLENAAILHPVERVIEHPLRRAQLRELARDDLLFERVAARIDQAQRLDGTQVS